MGGRGARGRGNRKSDEAILAEFGLQAPPAEQPPTEPSPSTEQVPAQPAPPPPPEPPPARQVDARTAAINGRWERALHEEITHLTRQPGDWVALVDLRAALDARGLSREAQDAHLKRMSTEHKLDIIPESNRKVLTDSDHQASIRIGGEENHLVAWAPEYQPPPPPGGKAQRRDQP